MLIDFGDYLGTFIFALTGGLAAAEKRLDFGGFLLLAFVTGVGGGTTRDLILGRGDVFWAEAPVYFTLCMAAALVTFFWATDLKRVHAALVWGDAIGLGVFTAIGAGIALEVGARPYMCVLMGVLTATGGGIMRDIIRNEIPIVLHRELYITPAAIGALILVGLHAAGAPEWASVPAAAAAAFGLRAVGIVFDLHLPVYAPAPQRGSS
jgi:uncharacterized membrane protein YeiH